MNETHNTMCFIYTSYGHYIFSFHFVDIVKQTFIHVSLAIINIPHTSTRSSLFPTMVKDPGNIHYSYQYKYLTEHTTQPKQIHDQYSQLGVHNVCSNFTLLWFHICIQSVSAYKSNQIRVFSIRHIHVCSCSACG
jgi:hypothetical protein